MFSLGSIVFIFGLIPAAASRSTVVPLKTSLPTAIVLLGYSVNFASLGLELSAAFSLITASLWLFIAMRRSRVTRVTDAYQLTPVEGFCTRELPHLCSVTGPCNGFPRHDVFN